MDKKKPTDEELRVFLLGLAGGFLVGGLVANCAEVFFIGWLLYFGGFCWLMFKKDLKTSETPQIVPFHNNHQL